jgi:Fe-S cluster assembly iron-binding protein IscA
MIFFTASSNDTTLSDDTVVRVDGFRLALDNIAASRLDGAVIDYRDQEEGYVIDHPDAVSAVWCG